MNKLKKNYKKSCDIWKRFNIKLIVSEIAFYFSLQVIYYEICFSQDIRHGI